MRSVSFHPEAREELVFAMAWYRDRSVVAAREFAEEVQAAIERIIQQPELYPRTGRDCRRLVLLHFPFDVVFRHTAEAIQIIAVAHHSRRPGYWRARWRPDNAPDRVNDAA